MKDLRLVRPAKEHETQAMEYLEEFYADKSETHGVGGLERYTDNYAGWLEKLAADRIQEPNAERVPAETFFLMKRLPDGSERLIGMINIRLVLNDNLWHFGGNIGYSIRPSERRKGYNKVNLFLALKFCQQRGLAAVLLDCDKENIGSARTMQALGGKLIRECPHPIAPENGVILQKYVIDVDEAMKKYTAQYEPLVAEYID